ncbi:hypothetical protein [Streptomyces sp. NPDC056785]|uniref:hypothetical protein n=1 Tax=Streptomyces sp. NPDC056785 TaxID=3345944 RepID=UPI0036ABCD0D
MTASWVCRKIADLETGSVHAWETAEGLTGNILVDPAESVARPCTPEGIPLGEMRLDKSAGTVENPDPDQELRHVFLIIASLILLETERQGRPPDRITRTYW